MCGVVGVCNLNGEPVPADLLKRMTDIIAHRGPDGEGHYVNGPIGLGHRRLALLDLTPAGRQPMSSEDGRIIIVCDGAVYNFKELRVDLEDKGHRFRSNTSVEVIIHGYEEEGIDFVRRLNGAFAFALWDARERTLFLVRDRHGMKPLYFWFDGNTLLFASEIKPILAHPRVSVAVNYDALNEYFTFQNLFRYHTLFQGVNLVPAACARWIQQGEGRLHRWTYWDYNFTDRDLSITYEEAEEEIVRLLDQAIERQIAVDVPVGSYLSGGIDSSSIVALVAKKIPRLPTFTCGFQMQGVEGVEAGYDERQEAEIIANHFETEQYEQVISAGDVAWALPRVIYHMEDLRMGMSYSNYYIARLASKFVKVCFTGAGGDELFGGYPWRYYRIFRSVDREEYIKEYYRFWQRLVPDEDKPQFFTAQTWANVRVRDTFEVFRRVLTFNENLRYDTPEDHIANAMYFEAKNFLHGVAIIGDRLSMAYSLEERAPYMDNDLVDFAQRIPIGYKLGNLQEMKQLDENETRKLRRYYTEFNDGKNIMRRAMANLLPQRIIERRKQGFSSPDESWYRGENINYVREMLLDPKAAYRDFLNPKYVEKVIYEHCQRQVNHRLLIWSLLSFEWWCRSFLYPKDDRQGPYVPSGKT